MENESNKYVEATHTSRLENYVSVSYGLEKLSCQQMLLAIHMQLRSGFLTRQTKITVFKSLVSPILLCGSEKGR